MPRDENPGSHQALSESEKRFRDFMEQAPFSVQIFAPDGHTVRVNRAWEELWGITLDQIADYNVLNDPQLEAKGVAPYLRRAFSGEAVEIPAIQYDPNETLPDRTRHSDPQRWVAAVAYPLLGPDRRVREVVLIHQDITGRKAHEEALRESAAYFRGLADAMPQLVWTARPDGTVEYYNSRQREYSGIAVNPDQTWDWQPVVHDDDLAMTIEAWQTAVSRGSVYQCEHRIRMADGSYRWHLSRAKPMKDEAGRIVKWFGTATDIHELRESQQVLRENNRRKDEFLAMLAHELRNPLAPIRNAAQVLKLIGPDDPNQQRAREIIERQTQHLTRLVDDLLDVSRITQGKIALAREPLDLATIINRAVETSRPLIEARHHQLTVRLAPESLRVEGDLTRLVQVVGNLINNAAKYTDEGGQIEVATSREDGEAVISVRDNGMGIPADLLPHVFDLFTQADRSLDRSQGGLGIGLTLVRQLVELHGGRVEARSQGPGRGSEFLVRLPVLATGRAGRIEESVSDNTPSASHALKVLIVEDNLDSAEMLAFMLTLRGHQVHVAHSGAEALEAARAFEPQAVLCDIGLPGMNGYEVAMRLRERGESRAMALIALTGYGQEEDRRRAKEAGFDYHLTKPVEPETLAELLDAVRPA
jgi:two-component system CheB/CheR fusion protein